MGVYTRKDSPYYWLWLERPGGRGLRRPTRILIDASTPAQSKENRRLADLEYHDHMSALAKDRMDLPGARAGITLDLHAAWYLTHYIAHRSGLHRERVIVAHLRRLLGRYDLREIDTALAREYVSTRLREGIKPQTANRELNTLKSLMREAVPRYLRTNPLAGMKRLKARVERKRMVRADEEAALVAALPPETRDLYVLAVDTLQRQANVAHLHRREVKGGYLAIEDSKTGPYTVPLSTRATAILARRLKDGRGWVFPDWHQRFHQSQQQACVELNRELRAAAKIAGIPVDGSEGRFSWHTATRATGASRMIAAGVSPRTVQMIGNWRSFDQMAAYLELDMGGGHAAVDQIAPAPLTPRSRTARRKPR